MRMCSRLLLAGVAAGSLLLFAGCAAFRTKVSEVDPEKTTHMDNRYDYSDLHKLTTQITDELLSSKFVTEQTGQPIMIVYGVQPRTQMFVDTKALTDTIRTALFKSEKFQFVNETQRDNLLKEQGYQQANVEDKTRVAVGKQLGAKYMMTGSLVETKKSTGRQVRVSETELMWYQLTFEISDLETGMIAWTTQKEFARQARKPLIGW
ncbi:MAG: hypothetical protein HY343_08880 [Lentisphaerae bacterium]|nr:hypothetical protein [Lentisphaerota bacterium]